MQNYEKRQTVRRLWLERPAGQRTRRDLVIFHEWLAENMPTLLKRPSQSFEDFQAEMSELLENPPTAKVRTAS